MQRKRYKIDFGKKQSIGETVVASLLDELGIYYFYDIPCFGNELRGVKNGILRFDFCIPYNQKDPKVEDYVTGVHNDFVIIEYNGIFHYHVIKGKTTRYTLTKQMMNDFTKVKFCESKNVEILWIPYWHHVKCVKTIVEKFIKDSPFVNSAEECEIKSDSM